jgi:hypothetical protein
MWRGWDATEAKGACFPLGANACVPEWHDMRVVNASMEADENFILSDMRVLV